MRTWGSSCLGPRDFRSAVGECYRINMLWIWNHSSLLYLPPTSWPDIQRCGHHAKLHIIISPRYVGPDLKTWNFQGHCLKECSSRLRPSVASYPKLQLSMTLTFKRTQHETGKNQCQETTGGWHGWNSNDLDLLKPVDSKAPAKFSHSPAVDGSEIRPTSWYGEYPHYLQGFIHVRWWSPDFFQQWVVLDLSDALEKFHASPTSRTTKMDSFPNVHKGPSLNTRPNEGKRWNVWHSTILVGYFIIYNGNCIGKWLVAILIQLGSIIPNSLPGFESPLIWKIQSRQELCIFNYQRCQSQIAAKLTGICSPKPLCP